MKRAQTERSQPRFRRWLLALAAVLLTLAVGEVAVRLLGLGPEISPIYQENFQLSENATLQYELVPGSKDGDFTINAAGLRDRDYALQKTSGVYRVACIGDSITYGFGAGQDQSYPTHLESLLREKQGCGTAEVLNFGVTGYNIGQTLENLKVRALDYAPDLVVYQYCVNDPQLYSGELEMLRSALTGAQKRYWDRDLFGHRLEDLSRLFALTLYVLEAQSRSGRLKANPRPDAQWQHLHQGSYADYFHGLHEHAPSWQRIQEGFAELARLGQERNFDVVIAIFPVLLDLLDYPLDAVHQKVAAEARRHGLPVVDLLPEYQRAAAAGGSDFVYNALHPSDLGYRLAAKAVCAALEHEGLLP
jgi:lysophospholipase L1-like esterase